MCHSKCGCGGGCGMGGSTTRRVAKILLIIGGLNWGLVGVGMLMGSNWNVVNLALGSVPTLEAIIYLLVGVAAALKLFGGRYSKCKEACGDCSHDSKTGGGM